MLFVNLPKEDKIIDMIARCNPKTYGGSYNLVELEKQIRGIEKIFAIIEVPQEKKVNIWTFNLSRDIDIWWGTVKDRLVGPEFTRSKFPEELGAKFNLVIIQLQKEKEFTKLRLTKGMTVMQQNYQDFSLSLSHLRG